MFSLYKLAVASALALAAAAETIRIDVGKSGLQFSPNSTQARVGDVLEFHFFAVNHSVAQGRFDLPCAPAAGRGFFSGFMGPVAAGQENATTFSVTVNDTNPMVFYCSQNNNFHCAKGMFGVVNPSNRLNLEGYRGLIVGNQTARQPTGGVHGGVFSVQSNLATATGTATTTGAPTGAANGTGILVTPTPTGTGTPSGSVAPQSTSTQPGGAVAVQASAGGLLAAVFGAMMML